MEKSTLKEVQIHKNFTSGAGNRMKHLPTVWTAAIVVVELQTASDSSYSGFEFGRRRTCDTQCDWNDVNSNFGDNCLSVLLINSHSLPQKKKKCQVTCLPFSNCK